MSREAGCAETKVEHACCALQAADAAALKTSTLAPYIQQPLPATFAKAASQACSPERAAGGATNGLCPQQLLLALAEGGR